MQHARNSQCAFKCCAVNGIKFHSNLRVHVRGADTAPRNFVFNISVAAAPKMSRRQAIGESLPTLSNLPPGVFSAGTDYTNWPLW